jgi:transcriptional regulator GlxA family with amidase domain
VLITIFAPPDADGLEITGPLEAFAEANRQPGSRPPYRLQLVAEVAGPLVTGSGLRVLPDATIATASEATDTGATNTGATDTLIVAGTCGIPPPPSNAVIAWLRRRSGESRRYGAVCTGAFLLGAAGLLDGRRATTHGQFVAELGAAFPLAAVQRNHPVVRDGPLFTAAGVGAAVHLALTLIEEDHGRDLALAVARRLVVLLRCSGHYVPWSVPIQAEATRSPAQIMQHWAAENPRTDLSVAALASRAGMSERHFSRIFRAETGQTPASFVEALRLEIARRALAETASSLQRIALMSGFSGTDALRRTFRRRFGCSPAEYRDRVRAGAARLTGDTAQGWRNQP